MCACMSDVSAVYPQTHTHTHAVRTKELDGGRGQVHHDVVKTARLDIGVNLHRGACECSHKQAAVLEACCCFVRERLLGKDGMHRLTMLYAVTLSSTCSAATRVSGASTESYPKGTLFRVAFSRR